MSKFKALLAFGLMAIATTAQAADMALPPEPPPLDDEKMFEFGSNWYLRGDIGWSGLRKPGISHNTVTDVFDTATSAVIQLGVQQSSPLAMGKPGGTLVGGFGVGYDFGFFRTDLTFDGRIPQKFAGTAPCVMAARPDCDYAGKIDALTVLANGYVDLGKWSGFSPYVGAGLGVAYVGISHATTNDIFGPGNTTSAIPNGHNWNFAWALMAGLSYEVSRNMKIDIGYRYLNLGRTGTESQTFTGLNPNDATQTFTTTRKLETTRLDAHEIRAGFRYMLD